MFLDKLIKIRKKTFLLLKLTSSVAKSYCSSDHYLYLTQREKVGRRGNGGGGEGDDKEKGSSLR